jgi:hypothetical protein
MIQRLIKKAINYRILTIVILFIFWVVSVYLGSEMEIFYLNSHIYDFENSMLVITISIILSGGMTFIFYGRDLLSIKEENNKTKRVVFMIIVYGMWTCFFFMMAVPPRFTALIPLKVNLLVDTGTVEKQFFIHNKMGGEFLDYALFGVFKKNKGSGRADYFEITKEKYENLKSKDEVTLVLTKGLLGIPHSAQVSKSSFKE